MTQLKPIICVLQLSIPPLPGFTRLWVVTVRIYQALRVKITLMTFFMHFKLLGLEVPGDVDSLSSKKFITPSDSQHR